MYSYKSMKQQYLDLLETAKLRENYSEKKSTLYKKIRTSMALYGAAESVSGVPARLIIAIHSKESSSNFNCNLHNGQPLNMVTTIVPKGRGPFKTWGESAIDALKMKQRLIDTILDDDGKVWTNKAMLWFAEAWNGFGYRKHGINSPYLWAGTTAYEKGGYSRDGDFDHFHVVKNIGIAPLITNMEMEMEFNTGVNFVEDFDDA